MRRLIIQLAVFVTGAIAMSGLVGVSTLLAAHHPDTIVVDSTQLAVSQAQLVDARQQLARAQRILDFSARYEIPADLTAKVYDTAVAEGIEPAVGFQLVKVESDFQNAAQSTASAIGLTQLRVTTARAYDATVDPSDLMNPDVNLRLGFRYLNDLLSRFNHQLPLALEAYNKGPTFVAAQQDLGNEVEGRYSKAVMGVRIKD